MYLEVELANEDYCDSCPCLYKDTFKDGYIINAWCKLEFPVSFSEEKPLGEKVERGEACKKSSLAIEILLASGIRLDYFY